MRVLTVLSVCVLLGAHLSVAAANLLVNGSFEDPVVSSNLNFTGAFSFSGWTGLAASGGSGNPAIVPGVSFALTPTDGSQAFTFNAGDSSSGSYIEQTCATSPLQIYTLQFDVGRDNGFSSESLKLEVQIFDSTNMHPFLTLQFSPPATIGYATEKFVFNPPSSTSRIRFSDISGANPDTDLFLDNVSVVQGVPEPSMGAFAACVFLAGGLTRRYHNPDTGARSAVRSVGDPGAAAD